MDTLQRLEDFTLFLFVHLATVDGSLHPNEIETIRERMNELFPGQSFEPQLEQYIADHKKLGTELSEDLLKESWKQFESMDSAKKAQLFAVLFDITNSDARVHEEETRTLRLIRSWITPDYSRVAERYNRSNIPTKKSVPIIA